MIECKVIDFGYWDGYSCYLDFEYKGQEYQLDYIDDDNYNFFIIETEGLDDIIPLDDSELKVEKWALNKIKELKGE